MLYSPKPSRWGCANLYIARLHVIVEVAAGKVQDAVTGTCVCTQLDITTAVISNKPLLISCSRRATLPVSMDNHCLFSSTRMGAMRVGECIEWLQVAISGPRLMELSLEVKKMGGCIISCMVCRVLSMGTSSRLVRQPQAATVVDLVACSAFLFALLPVIIRALQVATKAPGFIMSPGPSSGTFLEQHQGDTRVSKFVEFHPSCSIAVTSIS